MSVNARNGITVNTASVVDGISGLSSVDGIALASSGPNTWYDAEPSATGDTSALLSNGATMEWADVAVAVAGLATKARLFLGTTAFGTDTLKMALYDNAGNLLASGSAATPNAISQYVEVPFSVPVAVGAANFKVAFEEQSGNNSIWYKAGAGTRHTGAQLYAGFPPATLPVSIDFAGNFCASVFVQ